MIGAHPITLAPMTALGLRPPELVDLAATAGYDGVGIKIDGPPERLPFPILDNPRLQRATADRQAFCGLQLYEADVLTFEADGPTVDPECVLDLCAELGARIVMVIATDPELSRLASRLHRFCEQADTYGIVVSLEFMRFTTVRSAAEARELARTVCHSAFLLTVDTLHLHRSGGSPADALLAPELIGLVQACDAPIDEPPDPVGEAVGDRLVPGDGELPLPELLNRLPSGVPISVEVPSVRLLRELGAAGLAARSLAGLRSLMHRRR